VFQVHFVDDEPGVLEGFRRSLRSLRTEWQAHFHTSAAAALASMAEPGQQPDAVITDLRMPGMDGAELLEQVRDRHPAAARFVLSGQACMSQFSRAMRTAHQVLAKPCSIETVKAVVHGALSLRRLDAADRVAAVVSGIGALPASPAVLSKLTQAIQRPDYVPGEAATIVAQDSALTVRLLQIANSSLFGLRQPIESIDRAIVMLGTRQLTALVLHAKVVEAFPIQGHGFTADAFNARVGAIATAAHAVLGPTISLEDLRIEVMHAELGHLVLASRIPTAYAEYLERRPAAQQSSIELERRILGCTHAEVGGYLLALWGRGQELAGRVFDHHAADGGPSRDMLALAMAVGEAWVDVGGDAARAEALVAELTPGPATPREAWWQVLAAACPDGAVATPD
jgi:HD-like signal output (HDOD) protein